MARLINFFDGAQSGTVPTIGNLVASNLVKYANDAAFEAAEQGAPKKGNIYCNTTDNVIRYYNGSSWQSLLDENTTQTITNKSISGSTNTLTNLDGDEVIIDAIPGLTATDAQAAFAEHQSDIEQNVTDILARIPTSEKGANNGVAELDGGGKVPVAQLPSSLMQYQGTWDASTNTPTLTDGTGSAGDVYDCQTAGTVDFGAGNITFVVGDWAVYSGAVWEKSTNSDAVTSVNTQTGAVTLDTDDISEGSTNEYHTNAKVDARIELASIDDLADVDTTTSTPSSNDVLTWTGSDWEPVTPNTSGENNPKQMSNLGLNASAAASALTVALKQADGTTNPGTGGAKVSVAFRDTTLTAGNFNVQDYTAAESVVVPSGATLGFMDGDDVTVYVYAISDETDTEIAVSSSVLNECLTHNTTAISAAADSNALYSTSARTGAAIRLIGKIEVDAITTAGTWTTPDRVTVNQNQQQFIQKTRYNSDSAGLVNYTITANQYGDLVSFDLHPGKHEITLHAVFYSNGATTTTECRIGCSTTSGNNSTGLVMGKNMLATLKASTSATFNPITIAKYVVDLSASTTHHFKAYAGSSITNLQIGWSIETRFIGE